MVLAEKETFQQLKEAPYFFYSQAFADGIRATFAILLPALIGFQVGHADIGLTVALGAMCVSLTDAPGPLQHRRNGMATAAILAFLLAIVTGFARTSPYLIGLEVVLVTFLFSMFVVYGARATSVGNTAILVMILTMDKELPPAQVLPNALYILGGGVFYLLLSLALFRLQPYRMAQRVLGDCIRSVADYLAIRAEFYDITTNLDSNYRRLIAQQVVVNEKQDLVREIFFKTRRIVEESTDESRKLVYTFVETIDLFEQITASYYDYHRLRELFDGTAALELIHNSLKRLVVEINEVGLAIQTGASFRRVFDYDDEIKQLKTAIDQLPITDKLVLKRIAVNIRHLLTDLSAIEQYFETGIKRKRTGIDHSHFVTHQSLDPRIIWDNLRSASASFRHAVRVAAACITGFVFIQLIPYGTHSYWVLLTIAFIIKPAFALTKERNIQRIIGTVAGGAVGVAILLTVQNTTALFFIMLVFMLGTYSFMRINYLAMVACVTPYVLIVFTFIGTEFRIVASERIIDTVVGCAIAFSASYFLFPAWEAEQLKAYMQQILRANAGYLQKLIQTLEGQPVSQLEYKLARKEVYLASANLSAAFQRMLSEPKSKQHPASKTQQFVVLNHLLFSNIATLATLLMAREPKEHDKELIVLAKSTYEKLNESEKKLGSDKVLTESPVTINTHSSNTGEDGLLKEQLAFVQTLGRDIYKLASTINP